MKMFVNIPNDGYHLTEKQISIAEDKYGNEDSGEKRLD